MILSKKNIYLMYHQKKKEVINMKGEEFLKAVDLLEKEKHIDRDIIFETM